MADAACTCDKPRWCPICSRIADRRRYAKRKYGLTLEAYDNLVQKTCEICGQHTYVGVGGMGIDHTTDGSYHGVLCRNCNTSIGKLKHDPKVIRAALSYVIRTRYQEARNAVGIPE